MTGLTWEKLGACYRFGPTGPEDDLWFDAYEKDDGGSVKNNVDKMCSGCPVIDICLESGIKNKEYGVWGGLFLENGKISQPKNRHKADEVWDLLEKRHKKHLRE